MTGEAAGERPGPRTASSGTRISPLPADPAVGDPEVPAVLAVDGGNSKTDVAVVDADGTVRGTARGPGSNHQLLGLEAAMDCIGAAVSTALLSAGVADEGTRALPVGAYCLAGVDLPTDERLVGEAVAARGWSTLDVIRNDTFAVSRAGVTSGWGVGIVCGTGINCAGLGPDGATVRFPSLGELSGDFAHGGAWLGVRALGLALRSRDGRGAPTGLGRLVPEHFGLPDPESVLEAVYTGDTAVPPAVRARTRRAGGRLYR